MGCLMDAKSLALVIASCPFHGTHAVSICDKDDGIRMTPGKCCGQWRDVARFRMTEHFWLDLSRHAAYAADCVAAHSKECHSLDEHSGNSGKLPKESK